MTVVLFLYPFQRAVTSLAAAATVVAAAHEGWLSIIEANGAVG